MALPLILIPLVSQGGRFIVSFVIKKGAKKAAGRIQYIVTKTGKGKEKVIENVRSTFIKAGSKGKKLKEGESYATQADLVSIGTKSNPNVAVTFKESLSRNVIKYGDRGFTPVTIAEQAGVTFSPTGSFAGIIGRTSGGKELLTGWRGVLETSKTVKKLPTKQIQDGINTLNKTLKPPISPSPLPGQIITAGRTGQGGTFVPSKFPLKPKYSTISPLSKQGVVKGRQVVPVGERGVIPYTGSTNIIPRPPTPPSQSAIWAWAKKHPYWSGTIGVAGTYGAGKVIGGIAPSPSRNSSSANLAITTQFLQSGSAQTEGPSKPYVQPDPIDY